MNTKNQKIKNITIVPTSGRVTKEMITPAVKYLKGLDLNVTLSKNLFLQDRYLSGPAIKRVQDLETAFKDKNCHAIFCAKGGYGSSQMLPLINYETIKKNKKPFIGFSDTTALQLALFKFGNLPSISGVSLATDFKKNGFDPFTAIQINKFILNGQLSQIKLKALNTNIKSIDGVTSGGCLTLVTALMGTQYQASLKNKILIIEDTGEEPYSIDRMLTQLSQSKDFSGLKAIVLGNFYKCKAEYPFHGKIEQVLQKFYQNIKIPCFQTKAYGHQTKRQLIALGCKAKIKNNEITFQFS